MVRIILQGLFWAVCLMGISEAAVDESACYPPGGVLWSDEMTNLINAGTDIASVVKGEKPVDAETFKTSFMAYMSVSMIVLQGATASQVPGLSQAAGATVGVLGMILPKPESTELQCMRVLLNLLKEIQSKLDDIHKDVKHLIDLVQAMPGQVAYNSLWELMQMDYEVLRGYANDRDANRGAAKIACEHTPPYATRGTIRSLITESQSGRNFVTSLKTQARCNSALYSKFVITVLADIARLTALDRTCSDVLGNNNENSLLRSSELAVKDLRQLSISLYAGLVEMENTCLQEEINAKFSSFSSLKCEDARGFHQQFSTKYPTLKARFVQTCFIERTRHGDRYTSLTQKWCPSYTPSNCDHSTIEFQLQGKKSQIALSRPKNATAVAIDLIARQVSKCPDKLSACWPCDSGDRFCPD